MKKNSRYQKPTISYIQYYYWYPK